MVQRSERGGGGRSLKGEGDQSTKMRRRYRFAFVSRGAQGEPRNTCIRVAISDKVLHV